MSILSNACQSSVCSSSATVLTDGSSNTSAPLLRRSSAVRELRPFGLVTSTFHPARESFSYHPKSAASLHTLPTTIIAGVSIPCLSTSSFRVETVATTRFWSAVVPFWRTAAGISGSIPASRSPWQISASAAIPIRKTSVPFVSVSALKSMSYFFPALRCPVMICTDEQKSRCVTGIPLYAGTAMEDVTPGTISYGISFSVRSSSSSPPLPKRNGSPPLRRTTRFPFRASSRSTWLMPSCGIVCLSARFPTFINLASVGIFARTPWPTRLS